MMQPIESEVLTEFSRLLRSAHTPENDRAFADCCSALQNVVNSKRSNPLYLVQTDVAAITLGVGVNIREMSR